MTPRRLAIEQQIASTLTEDGGRVPVVVGLCGTGRTALLRGLEVALGADRTQYIDVERTASTPERFLAALRAESSFVDGRSTLVPTTPRAGFDALLAFLSGARGADKGPVTFLLDEIMEFRTFESFPGLRRALPELLAVIASSSNRFVVTSRYLSRTARALADVSPRFVVVPLPGLGAAEIQELLAERNGRRFPRAATPGSPGAPDGVARTLQFLSGGRPSYVRAVVDVMAALDADGGADPVAALAASLEPGGRLATLCHMCYELRLHRARGYGALKGILEILASAQPLTLTEVSRQLGRTPGSTKDYLSWLEDVDLVVARARRYSFCDALLRVWVRLHCRPTPPTTEAIGREVQRYAAACLPDVESAAALP